MAETYLRQSPLAHLHLIARAREPAAVTAGVRLDEKPFTHQFVLRGDADDAAFVAAVESELGTSLALVPNTVTGAAVRIIWLGPDEWLAVAPPDFDLGAKLDAVTNNRHAAVSDVSESRTILTLGGARVLDVLAKGCALDFHASAFGPGRSAQSMLAKAHVILHQTSDAPQFEIYVHRSFAEYLWAWLEDASAEYGLTVGH